MGTVFIHQSARYLQHRDYAHFICFLAGLAYPHLALVVSDDMLTFEGGYVCESQPGKAAEHESVTHEVEAGKFAEVKLYDALEFSFRKFLSLRLGADIAFAHEWIIFNPFVCDTGAYNAFEIADITDGGVVGATLLYAQEMLEVVNHSGCQFIHRNIFHYRACR